MSSSGRSILVVDDQALIVRLNARSLEQSGYEVLMATGAREAERLFREHRERIAVVVTDLAMPEISGRELIRRLRAASPEVRIVVLTGILDEEIEIELLQMGVAAVLEKPLVDNELVETVKTIAG